MSEPIPGKRIYPNEEGQLVLPEPGCYGQDKDGVWWARAPKGSMGMLTDHQVVEHADGTITVSPSILLEGVWHGYLERGIWREV